jgi:hypothetical protein
VNERLLHRRALFAFVALASLATGTVAACGADSAGSGASGTVDAGSSDSGTSVDAGTVPAPIGIANGVILLHAAAFPAFRLCFENYPELRAQPDATLMPRSNGVGVEIGTAVRIPPLDRAPGKVYVFNQKKVVATRGDSADPSCGHLLDPGTTTKNFEYLEAGEITTPIGTGSVTVLAITGCGNDPYLGLLGLDSSECDPPWDGRDGSLKARTLTLVPGSARTEKELPVQLFHLSSVLEKQREGQTLSVSFGELDASGALAQRVADAPALFDASAPVTLPLDPSSQSVYKTHGFRIAYGGAGSGVSIDQSLASLQELSSPDSLPGPYFAVAERYALLLLGDPRIPRTIDGGANPAFPLRSVHLVAVPVVRSLDAGTLTPSDAGFDAAALRDF